MKNIRMIVLILVVGLLVVSCGKESNMEKQNNPIIEQITETPTAGMTTEATTEATTEPITEVTTEVPEVTPETTPTPEASQEEAEFSLDFELSNGKGEMVNMKSYSGEKLLFVNFFTSWCGYCIEEMPEFQKIYDENKDQIEIVIVNVNFQDDITSDEVVAWYEESGYTFPMVIDADGKPTEEFYPYVQGFPTTFVYNQKGEYLEYISGALDEQSMNRIIDQYTEQ